MEMRIEREIRKHGEEGKERRKWGRNYARGGG